MTTEEYQKYDAVGLAQLVKDGEVSPGELLENALIPVSYTHLDVYKRQV